MEHPDVIREIDALIDSYNWAAAGEDAQRVTAVIKQALRGGMIEEDVWNLWLDGIVSEQAELAMLELFLQILQHPNVMHKNWVIDNLTSFSSVTFRDRPTLSGRQKYRTLQNAVPLLRSYLKHHNAFFRLHAAFAFSYLGGQYNQVAGWFLDHLQHENSFQVIFFMLEGLVSLLTRRQGQLIRPETREQIMNQLENRLKCKSPLMRLEVAMLLIYVKGKKTPSTITDTLIENWAYLDGHKERHWHLLGRILDYINLSRLNRDITIALVRNTQSSIIAFELWCHVVSRYALYYKNQRRIAFSADEKAILEAFTACKALWRTGDPRVPNDPYKRYNCSQFNVLSLESTCNGLRQQLKHARIIPESELHFDPDDSLKLISYPDIDR